MISPTPHPMSRKRCGGAVNLAKCRCRREAAFSTLLLANDPLGLLASHSLYLIRRSTIYAPRDSATVARVVAAS